MCFEFVIYEDGNEIVSLGFVYVMLSNFQVKIKVCKCEIKFYWRNFMVSLFIVVRVGGMFFGFNFLEGSEVVVGDVLLVFVFDKNEWLL